MSARVIDASVAAKWFFEEEHTAAALRLLEPGRQLHAQDFFLLEVDHVVTKRIRRRELSRAQGEEVRGALRVFPVARHPFEPLADPAFALACRTGRGLYDCLYLALALLLELPLVTADRRFFEALAGAPRAASMVWVGVA
jgi:predicted nucleic acid-binding protein